MNFRKSIPFKIYIILIITVILPLLLWSYFSYRAININDEKNANAFILNSLINTSDSIDKLLENIEFMSDSVINDEVLLAQLDNLHLNNTDINHDSYVAQNLLLTVLYNKKTISRYLNSLYLFSKKSQRTYSSSANYRIIDHETSISSDWYKSYFTEGKKDNWYLVNSFHSSLNEPESILVYYKSIFQFPNPDPIGFISFNVLLDDINNILSRSHPRPNYISYLFDSTGTVLTATDTDHTHEDFISREDFRTFVKDHPTSYTTLVSRDIKYLITKYQSPHTKWVYVTISPYKLATQSSSYAKRYFITTTFLLVIILLFLIVLLSLIIVRPFKELLRAMQKVGKGNFSSIPIAHNRTDEIGYIYDNFNNMTSEINVLINKLYKSQLIKKEAQLKVIQTEINEHFLYNTLDFIHWSAKINDVPDIIHITHNLSQFFRLSLNNGHEFTTVQDVMQMINCYLAILHIRFENKIKDTITVDSEIRTTKVLKYIFQPIVENAFKHGLETKRGKGILDISFMGEGNLIVFTVKDDGIGMKVDQLKKIQTCIHPSATPWQAEQYEENFALRNIAAQLHMVYGTQYTFDISSQYGKGTTVIIKIPAK